MSHFSFAKIFFGSFGYFTAEHIFAWATSRFLFENERKKAKIDDFNNNLDCIDWEDRIILLIFHQIHNTSISFRQQNFDFISTQ